jgi:hypothetical protein
MNLFSSNDTDTNRFLGWIEQIIHTTKLLLQHFAEEKDVLKKNLIKNFQAWMRKSLTIIVKLAFLAVIVWGGYAVILYFIKALWGAYLYTPMGSIFSKKVSTSLYYSISNILNHDLINLSYNAVGNALLTALLLGLCIRFLGILRYLYWGQGIVNRVVWGVICTAIAASEITGSSFASLQLSYMEKFFLFIIPVFCIFMLCFELAATLSPEFTLLFDCKNHLKQKISIVKIQHKLSTYSEE